MSATRGKVSIESLLKSSEPDEAKARCTTLYHFLTVDSAYVYTEGDESSYSMLQKVIEEQAKKSDRNHPCIRICNI